LRAWFDWNADGDFDDADEAVDLGTVNAGSQTLQLGIPSSPSNWATTGLYARFRLYPADYAQEFTVYGLVYGGEVEDYLITSNPTTARLEYFRATRTGLGQATLAWRTLVEVRTLGFQVDRATSESGWSRITPRIIPAVGSDLRPHYYELADADVPSLPGLKYRLVEVNLRGAEEVLAEALLTEGLTASVQLRADGLRIQIRGEADTQTVVETATDVVRGPWLYVGDVRLDGTGAGTVTLPLENADSERFYRLRQE
jgi:hypothetical protein